MAKKSREEEDGAPRLRPGGEDRLREAPEAAQRHGTQRQAHVQSGDLGGSQWLGDDSHRDLKPSSASQDARTKEFQSLAISGPESSLQNDVCSISSEI